MSLALLYFEKQSFHQHPSGETAMMNLMRRESELPTRGIFNQLMNWEPFFNGAEFSGLDEGTLPLDISEDDKNVIVRASVPGFAKEDIELEVTNGVLTIKATHNEEKE